MKRTALFEQHQALGGRMVEFAGWEMPVHYGSQLDEHHAVRRNAGMFDVSHMTIVDLSGEGTRDFLRYLLANDVARLDEPGRAIYSCMLNEQGGVIDDLITYYVDEGRYRVIVNAATHDRDMTWIQTVAQPYTVDVRERTDLAMIAVQGPNARRKAVVLLDGAGAEQALALKPFRAGQFGELFVARTGYTGEDGWEIMLPASGAAVAWQRLIDEGVSACGLGARDTLRLEAGMNLYGADMDESTSPLESGLAWTVAFEPEERDFIGRAALEAHRREGTARKLLGLVLCDRGVLRAHQRVFCEGGVGEVTSGTFSPTMARAIALARVPADTAGRCEVEIRGRRLAAAVVEPPFVRHGEVRVTL